MLPLPSRSELRNHPLESPRLLLTPLDSQDTQALWSAVESSRRDLERWLPWVPFNTDPQASLRYAEASAADWDQARACRFSMRERHTSAFVGVVGLEALTHLHENAELGYWLRSDMSGRGLMTEACRKIIDWAFRDLKLHRIRVAAATDNHKSLAVIARLGFHFEGIAREAERCGGRWLNHAVFALLSSNGETP